MTLAPDAKPKLSKKAKLRFDRRKNGHLLLYPERGLALDATALAIVKLCDGTRTIDSITLELAKTYRGDARAIANDVRAFLGELEARGLIADAR